MKNDETTPIDDLGFVSVLSSLLNLDEAEILKKINDNSKFFYLKRNVDYETGNKIKSWKFNGIHLEHSNKRNVYDSSTSNIIGFVDPDGNGIEGLELYFDTLLKGEDGELRYESAPNGAIIPQGEIITIQPKHGEDLILSIDSDLLFTDYEQREIYKKISLVKKNVYYFQIRSDHGHDAFFIEYDQISSFLKRCFK